MATKLYFHAAATGVAGTLPASNASVSATAASVIADGSNHTMNRTIGVSQTSIVLNTLANTSAQPSLVGRFISDRLASQTFALTTIGDISLSIAGAESNAQSNFQIRISLATWRPSTGAIVTRIHDLATNATAEPGTTQTSLTATNAAGGTSATVADGDVLICEVWRDSTVQAAATSRTNTIFYDGTTEASTTTNAAFINFPNDTLVFAPQQFSQAQADIKATNQQFTQSQAKINAFGTEQFTQSQAKINAFNVIQATQSQAYIKSVGVTQFTQTQAKLKSFGYPQFTQAQASIGTIFLFHRETLEDGTPKLLPTRGTSAFTSIAVSYLFNGRVITNFLTPSLNAITISKDITVNTWGYQVTSNARFSAIVRRYDYLNRYISDINLDTNTGQSLPTAGNIARQSWTLALGASTVLVKGDRLGITISAAQGNADSSLVTLEYDTSVVQGEGDSWVAFGESISLQTTGLIQHSEAQAYIKTVGNQFTQAQTDIKATSNQFTQSQAYISGSASQFTQAQADIKAVGQQYTQSQADIKAVEQQYTQSQADIKQTYNQFTQTQANIKQTYNQFSQAQANIKQTYQQYLQAQADVKQTYVQCTQAQGYVVTRGVNQFTQSQADIRATNNQFTQTQADIKAIEQQWTQTQADIKATEQQYLQAQADIKATNNQFTQSQADIKATYVQCTQTQAYIITRNVNQFTQSQADIKQIYQQYEQSQADIKQTYNQFMQSQTDIKATEQNYWQAQSDIKQTYVQCTQSQASIKTINVNQFTQAQTDIKQTYQQFLQTQADVKQTYNQFTQSQADIKQTYNQFAQTQADIKAIEQGYWQAQADVKATNNQFTQAQSDIKAVEQAYTQAQTYIKAINVPQFTQTQADIKAVEQQYTQAQAKINAFAVKQFTQAQANIASSGNFGPMQAQARIIAFGVKQFSQSQADIKVTSQAYTQAQASIVYTRFGQFQAVAFIDHNIYSARDGFGRVVATGWGTADVGGNWLGTTDSQISVNGSEGIRATTNTIETRNRLPFVTTGKISEHKVDFNLTSFGTNTGNAHIDLLIGTPIGTIFGLGVRIAVDLSNGVSNTIILAGNTGFGVTSPNISSNTYYTWKIQTLATGNDGLSYRGKLWQTSLSEPTGWDFEGSFASIPDTEFTVGNPPEIRFTPGNTTNTFAFDNYAYTPIGWTEVWQAQAQIKLINVNQFTQTQADIITVNNFSPMQAQAKINAFNYPQFTQSQADIKATGQAYTQSQADIQNTYQQYVQAQAYISIKTTNNAFAQAQGSINITENNFYQAQANIQALGQSYTEAQASIKQTYPLCIPGGFDGSGFDENGFATNVCSGGFTQAQALIELSSSSTLKHLKIADTISINLVLKDKENKIASIEDRVGIGLSLNDNINVSIKIGDSLPRINLQINDTEY